MILFAILLKASIFYLLQETMTYLLYSLFQENIL